MGFEITTATIKAMINLGNAIKKFSKMLSVFLRLITIYLSRLNIIVHQKKEPIIIKNTFSKIRLKAKYDEINARIEVRNIVKPIDEYFIIS